MADIRPSTVVNNLLLVFEAEFENEVYRSVWWK